MRMRIGLLSIVGFFGLLATANAQTTSASTAGTRFDGTYRFVSSAKVNPMYTAMNGRMAPCPDRTPGPLTIQNGQARYTAESAMCCKDRSGRTASWICEWSRSRSAALAQWRCARRQIDNAGTVRVRQIGSACAHDFVWQKE